MLQALKDLLDSNGISQAALGRELGISGPAMTQLILRSAWPRRKDRCVLQDKALEFLRANGIEADRSIFKPSGVKAAEETPEEEIMLLSKQTLYPDTKTYFGLIADPFNGDLRGADEVFMSKDFRYVREALYDMARHGGFMALVGESGSGKSTLRKDLIERLAETDPKVMVIEPYVLGMEDSEKKGKALRSSHIAEAIMDVVAPGEQIASSPEAKFRQVHKVLRESAKVGGKHLLIIEEAHALATSTLKHLKRFYELEQGFTKLISILLIGQPEIRHKLSQSAYQVREVVQRCEVLELRPLGEDLKAYIEFKLKRAGAKNPSAIIPDDAVEALRERLSGPASRRGVQSLSLAYPLAVGNTVTAALNMAAELGVPKVTADVIRRV